MSAIRTIKPLSWPDIAPGGADMVEPTFERANPQTLVVDAAYQRDLSERSVSLIRRILSDWDWRRFKPPVCVRVDGALHVIDGQHTAIAAASHPAIAQIPIMVIAADTVADRAKSFMGHNRDRIAVTPTQLHFAAVAAGDEDALTIDQVCKRAGVRILRVPPSFGVFKAGQTMSISAIDALIRKRGAMKARIVLQALAEAKLAPVSVMAIRAADMILNEDGYSGEVPPADLTTVMLRLPPDDVLPKAKVMAAAKGMALWQALGVTWFQATQKLGGSRGRRSSA